MILAALILQAAAPRTAVDAERAFNAAAQAKGQWTAFREYAAADAVMFVPQPVNTHTWLRERDDPPKSVEWWPTESYVSCDGRLAVNTGGWKRPNGSVGYFTTVWQRQADGGWKWIVDGGEALQSALPAPSVPKQRKATCEKRPTMALQRIPSDGTDLPFDASGSGASEDKTLAWAWTVYPDGKRLFVAQLWNGSGFDTVLDQRVAAPK